MRVSNASTIFSCAIIRPFAKEPAFARSAFFLSRRFDQDRTMGAASGACFMIMFSPLYQSIQTSRLLADAGWLKWNSYCSLEQKKKRRNRMKMSLLVVCLIGTSLFALSAASPAAPFGGGFHRNVQRGRMGSFAGGGRRGFIGPEFHASSGFRHDNHPFFHRQFHRFCPAFNVVAFGLPVWYPSYYYPDSDGYLENNNGAYDPTSDYQYWDSSAA